MIQQLQTVPNKKLVVINICSFILYIWFRDISFLLGASTFWYWIGIIAFLATATAFVISLAFILQRLWNTADTHEDIHNTVSAGDPASTLTDENTLKP